MKLTLPEASPRETNLTCGSCDNSVQLAASESSVTIKFSGEMSMCCRIHLGNLSKVIKTELTGERGLTRDRLALHNSEMAECLKGRVGLETDQKYVAGGTVVDSDATTVDDTEHNMEMGEVHAPHAKPDHASSTDRPPSAPGASSPGSSSSLGTNGDSSSFGEYNELDWGDRPELRDEFIDLRGKIQELTDLLAEKSRDGFHSTWLGLASTGMIGSTFEEFALSNAHRCVVQRKEVNQECDRIQERAWREYCAVDRLLKLMP